MSINIISMKKFISIIFTLSLISLITSGYSNMPETFVIDASKNAFFHNNLGINYLKEYCYYAAIQEFKIAISLSPNTQASSVYYKNLGDAYMAIGYPDLAEQAYNDAIRQYSLNFEFYQAMVKCYAKQNVLSAKIAEYSKGENPLNKVMLGLLYIESGNLKRGLTILDNFASTEPDLLITRAIKAYLKEKTNDLDK